MTATLRRLAIIATCAMLGFILSAGRTTDVTARHATATNPAARVVDPCPTPLTPTGYRAMFDALPSAQWGAADGAETVALPDGRSVWLFGDTFSDNRFVHSTAITQTRGCLHVSHAGAQLLPNDRNGDIYWIDHAILGTAGHVIITAERMHLTGSCTFCFRDTGVTTAADATISKAGDVTFRRWLGRSHKIAPAVTLSYPAGALDVNYRGRPILHLHPVAHEWIYSPQLHPELRLASGGMLLTMGHNWDDGRPGLVNYRPLFFDVAVYPADHGLASAS